MSWLALLLIGLGAADLVWSARPVPIVPEASGAALALVLGLLAGLTAPADVAALVVIVVAVLAWGAVRERDPRVALATLAAGILAAVLLSPYAGAAGGPIGDWLEATRLPVLHGLSADRGLLLLGGLLVQLSTGNTVVRLVLAATGTTPPTTGRRLKGGRLLGPMERLVIVGLGLAGHVTAASLVIAAKGLIRWPELQSFRGDRNGGADGPTIDEVTEYFLVGSFVSWLVALGSLVVFAR